MLTTTARDLALAAGHLPSTEAGTDTAVPVTVVHHPDRLGRARLLAVELVWSDNVTADAEDYAVVELVRHRPGADDLVLAHRSFAAGNAEALHPDPCPLVVEPVMSGSHPATLWPGDVLAVHVGHEGEGQALPAAAVIITAEPFSETSV